MRFPRTPLLVALLGAATQAVAGGFQVNLAAQKNIGMGHVGTGLALDQGSMFFNPGALTFVQDRGIVLGATAAMARTAFRDVQGQSFQFKHDVSTPFHLYAGFGPKEGKWRAGLAIYTPFGSELNYGHGWTGRYSLTSIQLAAGYIQPTVAYQVTDWLGIGAGFVYALGYVNLEKDILAPFADPTNNTGYIKLESESPATGIGFNAGLFLKPTDMISIGLSYRSKVEMEVKQGDGKVTVNNLRFDAAVLDANFAGRGKGFGAKLPLPATSSIGIGVMPTDKLTVGVDFNFVQWSAYKSLDFTFDDKIGGSLTSSSKRNYKDAWTARLGAQYRVADKLTLRAGGYFDKSPVRDGYITPETPDADRVAVTGGLTLHAAENFDIDLAYEFMNFKERGQTQAELVSNGVASDRVAGTYHTQLNLIGVGIGYKF